MLRKLLILFALILIGLSIYFFLELVKRVKNYNLISDCIFFKSQVNDGFDKIDKSFSVVPFDSTKQEWSVLKSSLLIKTNKKIDLIYPLVFGKGDSSIYRINRLFDKIDLKFDNLNNRSEDQELKKLIDRLYLEYLRSENIQKIKIKNLKMENIQLGIFLILSFGLSLGILFKNLKKH